MKILRFFIVFLLVQSIFFTTTANAAVGGWTMSNPIAAGASTVYTGTKQLVINGADYIKKGTAKITPPASGVAKVLARGVAGYALSVAVEQLLGAVDWVLDPANNQIKYYVESVPDNCSTSSCDKFLKIYVVNNAEALGTFPTPERAVLEDYKRIGGWNEHWANPRNAACTVRSNLSTYDCTYTVDYQTKPQQRTTVVRALANPNYDPNAEREQRTIPLETVAQKVISNAESGDTNAQVATGAAAADIVAEAETDQTGTKARPIAQQLENSASTKPADEAAADKANEATGEQTKNPDKPDTTDLKLTFPIFCNWAPTVCEAAQTVISFPKTLTNWWETGKEKAEGWATSISESWTAAKEWAKSEETEDTELDIPVPVQPDIDTDIAFGGNCPADHEAQINMGVGTIKMPISYEPICTTVSTAKPVLIFVGFFIAALIIGGVKTE